MPNEKYGYNEYTGLSGAKLRTEHSRLKRRIAGKLTEYKKTAGRLMQAAEKLKAAEEAAERQPNKIKLARKADQLAYACEPLKGEFSAQGAALEEDLLSMTKLYRAMEASDKYTKGAVAAQKAATLNAFDYEKAAIEESVAYVCPVADEAPAEEEDELGALTSELRSLRAALSDLKGQVTVPACAVQAVDKDALYEEIAKVRAEFEELLQLYAIKAKTLNKSCALAGKALASAERKPRKKKRANRALELNGEREINEEDLLLRSDELNKRILIVETLYSNLILLAGALEKVGVSNEKRAVSMEMRESKRRAELPVAPWIADEVLSLPAYDANPTVTDNKNEKNVAPATPTEEELMEKALVDELRNGQNEVMRTLTTLLLEMRHTPAPAYEPQRPVRVAPVTVDVSKAVDKAVEAAMENFRAAFDSKIEEYMTNVASPLFANMAAQIGQVASVSKPVDTEAFDHAYQLSSKISDDERFLIEKLTAMLESIKALNDEMMAMTEALFAVSERQKEIAELQQQTNDLQRYTMREQEGVQVNQKVISTDQVTVIEAQTLIGEQQKTINEQQQAVVDSQKVMLVEQKMVIDAQATLDEAMKTVADEQQNLINGQQEILKDNARNIDMQNEIAAIQAEITAAQKETFAAQKQLTRDQKAINDKQRAGAEANAQIAESVKAIVKEHKAMSDMLEKLAKKTAPKD